MLNINLDLGTVPSVLQALQNPRLSGITAKAMAESYVDDIHGWINAGRAFTPRSAGGLEQAINWRPLTDGAEVYANKDYAHYVEQGTGIPAGHSSWVIRPKPGRKALKFPISGGGFMFRRSVVHKGSQPHPFFFIDQEARAQNMQERALSVLARVIGDAR